jgi:hypothetical protein
MSSTIRWGSLDVPLIRTAWRSEGRHPYRKTYALKAGQAWRDAPVTPNQLEWYVSDKSRGHVPVGALIADEFASAGAIEAAFVEMWGSVAFVDHNLVCIPADGPIGQIFVEAKRANGNKSAGFPDVVAVFADGRIAFREAKNRSKKDRLQPQQHQMADVLRGLYGTRADFAVVEWDIA